MFSRLSLAIEHAWSQPPRWLLLLLPVEWLFAGLTALRRYAFKRGWIGSGHPGVPVVVVGNINVGGTGKTPVVVALATALSDAGMRVAVVSRGYGGSAQGTVRVTADANVQNSGDEALLIARSTAAMVFVDRDRLRAARAAREAGADVIISDDGLQHYRLQRDIEIVTLDADVGFGNGHLLPVGPLREPRRRLADVDHVLVRNGQDPHSGTAYRACSFRRLDGSETRPLQKPGFGPAVHAIAGIARPGRFFDCLRELGLEPVEHPLADHGVVTSALRSSLQDLPVLMTEKDAVKYAPDYFADAWVLQMGLDFPATFLARLMQQLGVTQGVDAQLADRACRAGGGTP